MDSKEIRKQRESLTGSLIGIYWRVYFRGIGYIKKKYSTKFPCSSKQPPTHALTNNHNQTKWIRSKQIKAKIPIQFKGNWLEKRFLVGEVKGTDKIVESGKDLVSEYPCLNLLNNKKQQNVLDVICDIVFQKY